MPTFKLEDLGDDETFGGDNDMYFRQWRQPSMKPVLNEKLDRDFRASIEAKENFCKNRAERKKRHEAKFDKKMEELTNKISQASLKPQNSEPFLPAPSEDDLKIRRELWNREFETPSSTAVMSQAKQLPMPRRNPIFGKNMAGLKSIVLPPVTTPQNIELGGSRKPTISESSTPKDHSFLNNSHETIFYPQTHSSFNLDHYNGNRPSFAFAGLKGATSTPVGKTHNFAGIAEEVDDSVMDNSRYVTALESPISIQTTQKLKTEKSQLEEAEKAKKEAELQAKLAAEKARLQAEKQQAEEKARIQKELEEKQAAERARVELQAKQAAEKLRMKAEVKQEAKEPEKPSSSEPVRIHAYLKNYIALLPKLLEEKAEFEKSADPHARSLLKRTVIEKVSVFTQRETSTEKRNEILEFFKSLLNKKEVDGFAVLGEPPKLKLSADAEVHYAVHCIVEKYISLASLDAELTSTISDLISRLSQHVRRTEKVFIVMMLNKSVLLRQNPAECIAEFIDNSSTDPDEKAQIVNRENALLALFFNVFMKNAYFASKGRKMVLNEEVMWKYADATVEYATEVPKSAMVLLQLITYCKPQLCQSEERWSEMLARISEEIVPSLEEEAFPGDEAVVSQLKQIVFKLI